MAKDLEEGTELRLQYDPSGLLPAIVQHADSGAVLMMAHMNEEALMRTLATGEAHFWSRSRQKLWRKGEVSGEVQQVLEILIDCDLDALLVKVRTNATGAACHTGRRSCFYRRINPESGKLEFVDSERLFDPAIVYAAR
jgi:phosphoribosyl-AMP cyclohydrolase